MEGHQILAHYEKIALLTRRMLDAARGGEWERLIELERDCSKQFAPLFESAHAPVPDADYVQRKSALIHGILADDAAIRLLVEPWLAQLSQLIGSTRSQSRLQQAYRAD